MAKVVSRLIDEKQRCTIPVARDLHITLEAEASATNMSKNAYVSTVIVWLDRIPSVLSGRSKLDELKNYHRLVQDPLIKELPKLARIAKRDPVDHLLFLLDKGYQRCKQEETLRNIVYAEDAESLRVASRNIDKSASGL